MKPKIKFSTMSKALILILALLLLACSPRKSAIHFPEPPDCKSTCRTDCWESGCASYRPQWVVDSSGECGHWECIKIVTGSSTCEAFEIETESEE
jgi:hypothetical protein